MKIVVTLMLTLALTGCPKDKGEPTTKESTEKAPEEKAPAAKGLEAPGNDAAVIAEVKKVLACEWKSYGFSSSCEAYKAFRKAELIKQGRADATMVNLLEDTDEKVRWLGAVTLKNHGKVYESDAKLATRVVDAAKKETAKRVAGAMMKAVSEIDLVGTKLEDRVIELAKSHSSEEARAELVHSVMFKNKGSTKLYDFIKGTAKDAKEERVRRAGVRAFWIGTPRGKTEEVCKLWLDIAQGDASDEVAGTAMRLAAQNPNARCQEHYDALLALAEKKAKEGAVKRSDVVFAVKYIHGQKKATDPQKKKALAIAMAVLEKETNKSMARGEALRLLGKEHPKGKALAKKYKDDKEFFIKTAAKRILEGK